MKVRPVVVLGAIGLGAAAVLSQNRSRECRVSMHPEDWRGLEDGDTHRRYSSMGQTLHHTKEFAALLVPAVDQLYLRPAISPAFREQIMIVTATCNDCAG